MPEARPYDPLTAYRFEVSGGDYLANGTLGFSRVSGLEGEIGVKEWRQLSDPSTPIKLPTEAVFGDVTLERGIDPSGTLRNWWDDTRGVAANGRGILSRFTITIKATGRNPQVKGSWKLYAAWPRKVKWGDFDALSSGVLIESLTLANEGVERVE